MIFKFLLALLLLSVSQAEEIKPTYEKSLLEQNTKEQRDIEDDEEKVQVTKTYKEATGDEDTSKWNMQDWKNNFQKNGANTGAIGRMQTFWGQSPYGEAARSGNPNLMNSEYLKTHSTTKDINAIQSWNNQVQETLKSSTLNSSSATITGADEGILCYITRDIPPSYKCNLPNNAGLLYGGEIGESGDLIKKRCENECFEQRGCVEINHNPEVVTVDGTDIDIDTTAELESNWIQTAESSKDNLESIFKMDILTFDVSVEAAKDKMIYVDFTYIDRDYKEIKLLDRYRIYEDGSQTVPINSIIRSAKLKLYTEDEDVKASLSNLKYSYIKNGRYICQAHQDISTKNPGQFAKLCPSGNIVNIDIDNKSYKICADYGVVGDNADGTFSTLDACQSICKRNYDCTLEMGSVSIDALKSFREGCIIGQADCNDNLCKDLRVNGAMILEENVFDAGQHPRQTIVNGAQIPAVERPRPNADQDLEFDELLAQENKDDSWKNMLQSNSFRVSAVTLDGNTQNENAFAIGINNDASYGYASIDKRAGYWVHKPSALDVDSGALYKFYAVLDVVTQRNEYNEFAQLQAVKDRILYVKTSNDDTFKPFARRLNYAYNNQVATTQDGVTSYTIEHTENKTSQWKFESFNEAMGKWYTISPSLTLENFHSETITMETPTKRRMVIGDLNSLYYSLPGIKRRVVTEGPYETPYYDGAFDGTGDIVGRYAVHVYYTNGNAPTYQSMLEDIENGVNLPIYDNLSASAYSQNVLGEGSDKVDDNIKLYLYGTIDKKTGFIHIKPDPKDVGQYGHIFIRAIE